MSASKNVGFNKWYFSTNGSLDVVDDYLRIIQLRSTNSFLKRYWGVALKSSAKTKYNHLVSVFDQVPNIGTKERLKAHNVIAAPAVENFNNLFYLNKKISKDDLFGFSGFFKKILRNNSPYYSQTKILTFFFKDESLFKNIDKLNPEISFLSTTRQNILNKFFKKKFSFFNRIDLSITAKKDFNLELQNRNSIIFDESQR